MQPQDGLKGCKSGPFFREKWPIGDATITRVLAEEDYSEKYDLGESREDIRNSWNDWSNSVIGLEFGVRPNQGPSRTHHFLFNNSIPYRHVLDATGE